MSELHIHIIPGPDGKLYTDKYKSAKWCRKCRKRLVHRGVILYDTKPSYYDPLFVWECPCGAHD